MRIRLNLSYDGSEFRGWQIQPQGRTVQGELEAALSQLYGGEDIRSYAAGRTDSGVHAVMQVVHFDTVIEREEKVITKALNSLLPEDVRIWRSRVVEDDFHARFSARGRLYAYRILRQPDLYLRRYGWSTDSVFHLERVLEASGLFLGQHDFRAFSTQPDPDESTICDIRRIEWREDEYGWIMEIEADRFIRRLVRTITGAIVSLAAAKVERESLERALQNGRGRVPPPAPPQGLALVKVRYESDDEFDVTPFSLWGTFHQAE
ncbi:MAG TPA: tRNA pseudouridine(38-40) synthase TruA [Bacteroidetes bacterium]|nr:tRNA pseudouridine(38-40) synthase TruA [Bacteroidota bacterium]HEX04922.1 tRNA pseudouridine(38-40) synthase TruA [Bacteroidota bacterium]